MDREQLSTDMQQVADIEKGISQLNHPVISVLENQRSTLIRIKEGYDPNSASGENPLVDYISRNLGNFADKLEEASPFSLSPEELTAIWIKVREMFETQPWRIAMARIISSVYITQDAPSWKGFSRRYLENVTLPTNIFDYMNDLNSVKNRVNELSKNLKVLQQYAEITPSNPFSGEERSLTEIICDNFSNGFKPLEMKLLST